MDKMTREQRSNLMRSVKASGSKIELLLLKALFRKGYRYRKNDKSVFGKPDITFKKLKIAVFVDSEFWHGKNWAQKKRDHKSNKKFWYSKIERNIERDKEVNRLLRRQGWIVLRFWGRSIEKKLDSCVSKIEDAIRTRKTSLQR